MSPVCSGLAEVLAIAWTSDGCEIEIADRKGLHRWSPGSAGVSTWATFASPFPSKLRSHPVAWSPDGIRAVTADSDGRYARALLWDRRDPSEPEVIARIAPWSKMILSIDCVAWHPNEPLIAAGFSQYLAVVLDVSATRDHVLLGERGGPVDPVEYRLDGEPPRERNFGHKEVWLNLRGTRAAHTEGVSSVAWSPDGTRLATAGRDHRVRLWDIDAPRKPRTCLTCEPSIDALAWSPLGSRLAISTYYGIVYVTDPDAPFETLTFDFGSEVRSIVWSPDGSRLAVACTGGIIAVVDLNEGGAPRVLGGHLGGASSVAWRISEPALASGGLDGSVRTWITDTTP